MRPRVVVGASLVLALGCADVVRTELVVLRTEPCVVSEEPLLAPLPAEPTPAQLAERADELQRRAELPRATHDALVFELVRPPPDRVADNPRGACALCGFEACERVHRECLRFAPEPATIESFEARLDEVAPVDVPGDVPLCVRALTLSAPDAADAPCEDLARRPRNDLRLCALSEPEVAAASDRLLPLPAICKGDADSFTLTSVFPGSGPNAFFLCTARPEGP
jgi:hypothetical protein